MSFNLEIFSLIICVCSFLGLLFFIYRKVPVLAGLPEREIFPIKKIKEEVQENLKITLKERLHIFEASLQKTLQRSRVYFLKADNYATNMIKKLRERSDRRKIDFEDHWKDLRFTLPIKKSKTK
jgi:hypothetical protein